LGKTHLGKQSQEEDKYVAFHRVYSLINWVIVEVLLLKKVTIKNIPEGKPAIDSIARS